MAATTCRIIVLGPQRRLDLAVPAAARVAEVIPEFVRLSGGAGDAQELRRWSLGRLSGQELPGGSPLADCGILDGETLVLRHPVHAPARLIGVDLLEAATESADESPGQWSPHGRRVARLAMMAVPILGLAAVLFVSRGHSGAGFAALGVAVLLAGVAAIVNLRDRVAAAVLVLAAMPTWSAAGSALLEQGLADGGLAVTGARACVGAVAASLAAYLLAPAAREVAAAAGISATVGTLAWLAATAFPAVKVAGVTAVLTVAALPLLPTVALRLAGVRPSASDSGTEDPRPRLDHARRQLVWLLLGCATLLVGGSTALAITDNVFALALCGLLGTVALLRSRAFRFTAEVVPVAATGFAVLAILDASYILGAIEQGQWIVAGALALGPALILLAPTFLAEHVETGGLPHHLRRAETLLTIALLPLLLGVLGVYDVIGDAASGLL